MSRNKARRRPVDGSSCLVTGGAGLIGSHLVDALLARGCCVTILDNLDPQTHPRGKPQWVPGKARFVLGDVRDPRDIRKALRGVDYVFHQAAFGGFTSEHSRYMDVNATGTARLFEVIRRGAFPVKKVVVASSQAIYGEGKYSCAAHGAFYPGPRRGEDLRRGVWEPRCPTCAEQARHERTGEESPKLGASPYAISKYAEERIALAFGHAAGVPTVALRYGVTYGPRQSVFNPYTGVVSIFSTLLLNGRRPVVYEDGRQERDFIYVGDVAAANIFVAETPAADFEPFNVAWGQGTPISELALKLSRAYGLDLDPQIDGSFRPQDARHFVQDPSKLYGLGWRPQVPLDDGVARYVEWIRSLGRVREYFSKAERALRKTGVVIVR